MRNGRISLIFEKNDGETGVSRLPSSTKGWNDCRKKHADCWEKACRLCRKSIAFTAQSSANYKVKAMAFRSFLCNFANKEIKINKINEGNAV